MTITEDQAAATVKPFGFVARKARTVFFLNEGGDDLMSVSTFDGEITVYEHNAQAFLAASVLAKVIKQFA